MITEAYSYFLKNGNTGYHDLSVSYVEDDIHKTFFLRTGVEEEFQNFLMCDLDDILVGELTQKYLEEWDKFKSKPNYKELVILHDQLLIKELEWDLKEKEQRHRNWLNSKED